MKQEDFEKVVAIAARTFPDMQVLEDEPYWYVLGLNAAMREKAWRIPKDTTKTPEQLYKDFMSHHLDHITRITGYFTKINQWNKGKLAELSDRYKSGLSGNSNPKAWGMSTPKPVSM